MGTLAEVSTQQSCCYCSFKNKMDWHSQRTRYNIILSNVTYFALLGIKGWFPPGFPREPHNQPVILTRHSILLNTNTCFGSGREGALGRLRNGGYGIIRTPQDGSRPKGRCAIVQAKSSRPTASFALLLSAHKSRLSQTTRQYRPVAEAILFLVQLTNKGNVQSVRIFLRQKF